MNLSISEPHFVLQISQPPNIAQKWFCIQNLHMGDSTQPQQKSAGAGESSDFGAIRAGPSQMATFMPFWI